MRVIRSVSANACSYYMIESYRDGNNVSRTRIVEKLGTDASIKEKYQVDDAYAWCKDYAARKTLELSNQKNKVITINIPINESKDESFNRKYNFGYLILEDLYYSFGFGSICKALQAKNSHITSFMLDDVLRNLLIGRIICPLSKGRLINKVQDLFLTIPNVELQHIYQGMGVFVENIDDIQDQIFNYTSQYMKRDVSTIIYYDCTNLFCEIEEENNQVSDKSIECCKKHTLPHYDKAKENSSNPIVQVGLLMDANGMPLSFCVNASNTNEQVTPTSFESKLIKNIEKSKIIVCTDYGLSSVENHKFNNLTLDNDPLVKYKLKGKRNFICEQSFKKLKEHLKTWALDPSDKEWFYVTYDHQKKKDQIVSNIDLATIISKNDDSENPDHSYYDTIFYKERTIVQDGIEQRLIVSFSLKHRDYEKSLRENHGSKANKMIANGTFNHKKESSFTSHIRQEKTIAYGEVADQNIAFIDQNKIEKDELYDGFCCIATNIFNEKKKIFEILSTNSRKCEIEECFRMMNLDLNTRSIDYNQDTRIKAHLLTCFMALMLCRGIAYRLSQGDAQYPIVEYTMQEILDTLRTLEMNMINENDGIYIPQYQNSELISELLSHFDLESFSRKGILKNDLKKIIKKIEKNPILHS